MPCIWCRSSSPFLMMNALKNHCRPFIFTVHYIVSPYRHPILFLPAVREWTNDCAALLAGGTQCEEVSSFHVVRTHRPSHRRGKASYIVTLVCLCIHLNFISDCASGFGQMQMRYSLYAQAKLRLLKSSGLTSWLKTVFLRDLSVCFLFCFCFSKKWG